MTQKSNETIQDLLSLLFRAHPWHGVDIGPEAPDEVTAYIEIVPTDTVKYELDKITGVLRIDRPQRYSNVCPALYGIVPQTYCGQRVAQLCAARVEDEEELTADQDPLDICILTEKSLSHGDILVRAIPIGGLRLLDNRQADDKILAVLAEDATYGTWTDIAQCPAAILHRLEHYFLTYKDVPGSPGRQCRIAQVYGREEAHDVIRRSQADYQEQFGSPKKDLLAALRVDTNR
jgi:inorganic pyrophosphatase